MTVAVDGSVITTNLIIASSNSVVGTLNIGALGVSDTAGTITAATIAFGSGSGTINFNQSDSTSVSAVISGSGSVKQLGTGTTVLSGSNSYSGGTTISAGTLLANNTAGSALGSSSVTVQGSGTLSGNGSIDGSTTIASGGTLAPGSGGTGALGFRNDLTLLDGSTTTFLINSTNSFTSINAIGSTLTYGGSLVFNILSYTPAAGDAFKLFNMTGGAVAINDFSSVTAGSLIFVGSNGIWTVSSGGLTYRFSDSTGQLTVTAAVPEPSTCMLLGIAMTAMVAMIVRRRHN